MGDTISKNVIDEATSVVNNIITNVVSTTNQQASQLITVNQINNFKAIVNLTADCGQGGFNVCLSNNSDISSRLVTNFTSQASTQIQNALRADITNDNSQIMKIVKGFLAGLGGGTKTLNQTTIKNMISNYINNNINITTLQSSLQNVTSLQANNLTLLGNYYITANGCNFKLTNSSQAAMTFRAIASTIVDNFIKNDVSTQVLNRASQVTDVKEEGIGGALMAAAVLAIACGFFYVLRGIGQRISAKAGVSQQDQESNKSFNNIMTIIFVVIVIAIIGFFLYNQYSKKNWPFTPSVYYGCKLTTFTDPVTGQKSIITDKGCAPYTKDDNRGIYKSQQECELRQTDASNGTCSQFWGCQYDSNKKLLNSCTQYPSVYYTINWKDGTKTQVNASYVDAQDCMDRSNGCSENWTCVTDEGGFPIKGQCRQIDSVEAENIRYYYGNQNICGQNFNANKVSPPIYDSKEKCEQDAENKCNITWSCTNPGGGSGNSCSKNICPLVCDKNDLTSCPLGLYGTQQECENQCNQPNTSLALRGIQDICASS